jgi:hypothetical protein
MSCMGLRGDRDFRWLIWMILLILRFPAWVATAGFSTWTREALSVPVTPWPCPCVSGFSITTGSWWHWISQPTGNGLEWTFNIFYNHNNYHYSFFKSHNSISRDTCKNLFSVLLHCITTKDSAIFSNVQKTLQWVFIVRPDIIFPKGLFSNNRGLNTSKENSLCPG